MRKQLLIRPVLGTTLLLSVPLIMTVVDRNQPLGKGWRWGLLDFVVMGALLMAAGSSYELISPKIGSSTKRIALGFLITAVVLAIWVELAVGGISQIISWATA